MTKGKSGSNITLTVRKDGQVFDRTGKETTDEAVFLSGFSAKQKKPEDVNPAK